MTGLEKAVVRHIIEDGKNISITTQVIDLDKPAGEQVEEVHSHAEMMRLFDSPDFKKGWELCQARMGRMLEFLVSGNTTTFDLRKFLPMHKRPVQVRRTKRKKKGS